MLVQSARGNLNATQCSTGARIWFGTRGSDQAGCSIPRLLFLTIQSDFSITCRGWFPRTPLSLSCASSRFLLSRGVMLRLFHDIEFHFRAGPPSRAVVSQIDCTKDPIETIVPPPASRGPCCTSDRTVILELLAVERSGTW
jgi:hypothetical protein